MNRASILQVAYEVNIEIVESALGLIDGIEVEEALLRVHVGTIASIDNRHRRNL